MIVNRIFSLHVHSWSDGLLSGQRPPHDAPHLSSRVSAPRLRHQPGAHDGETPAILFVFHHLLVLLVPVFAQRRDSAQPLLLIPRDPVPLLTSDQFQLLPAGQRLRFTLPACTQVSFICSVFNGYCGLTGIDSLILVKTVSLICLLLSIVDFLIQL